MHKVLVVDDEPIVRLAIKSLVNWENHGFLFDFEASNGRQALKILDENPDIEIVITDINMPVMNGLELISEIKDRKNTQGIIVLSAYNDYSLVRQAFKLGALDYILKTEMDPDNVLKILSGLVSQMDEKHQAMNKNNNETNVDLRYSRESFLKELLERNVVDGIEERIQEMDIKLGKKNIVICYLWVDDFQIVSDRYDENSLKSFITSVYNSIYQVLADMNKGEAINISPQEYVMFFSFESISESQIRERLVDILSKIKHSLLNYVNISVSIGVSEIKSGYEHIGELFKESAANARLRFIFGKDRIIFPEVAGRVSNKTVDSIIGKENKFILALKEAESDKAQYELEVLLKIIRNSNPGRIDKIYASYMEIIFIIINFLSERGEDTVEIFGKDIDFYDKITQFEIQEEINEWIKDITDTVITYLREKKDVKVNRAIARAQEFIKGNYGSDDITLKMVSEYIGLSESHFSYIFTKKTGETFTDYLTRIRIEKAKELLESTSLKVYEVSVSVGYANVEHFSRVFKKMTGQSPNNYKNL